MNQNNTPFVTYEYATITVKRDAEPLYTDCYRSFGWQPLEGHPAGLPDPGQVAIKMKRDRRLDHRSEVNQLQRQCEAALGQIDTLERQKTSHAFIAAMVVGLMGTVFMALAVFSMVFWNMIPLVVLFGLIGFIGWGAGYLAYRNISKKKGQQVAPLVDAQYDVVYDTCEKASAMLA